MEKLSLTTPELNQCSVNVFRSPEPRKKIPLRLYDRGPFCGFEDTEIVAAGSRHRVNQFYFSSYCENAQYFGDDLPKQHPKKEEPEDYTNAESPVLSSAPLDSPSPISPSFLLTCTLCRSATELNFLHTFADRFSGTFSSTFSEATTHVVVNTNSSSKTFKLLLGIAYRLPVITYDWVEQSMKYNELLNPVDFLFNEGARRCLTDKAVPPFCDSVFFLSESVVTLRSSAMVFEKLLSKVGGKVERSFTKICKMDSKFKFFVFSNSRDPGDFPLDMLVNYHVTPVSLDWISESIYCYKKCDIEPHLCPLYPTERVPPSLFC